MAKTPSTMLPLGTPAPDFNLPDPSGKFFRMDECRGPKGLLVMFICNHCPFVKHIADKLAVVTSELQKAGIGVVAINSNDVERYPDDRPELMAQEARQRGYTFPYLYDGSQSVARAYQAACTPDFYLFGSDLRLFYRGRFDGATPGNNIPVTGAGLQDAAAALLASAPPPAEQQPSIGCNIKWRQGHEPGWFQSSPTPPQPAR